MLEDIGPDRFLAWTRGADLCFPNLQEGSLLAGAEDPDQIAADLLGHYPAVILKLGAEGARYADTEGRRARIPATLAQANDTTGAGDALCAGFLAGWLADEAPNEALRRGVRFAARAVGQIGGRPGE
jgi:sugar/nucleoside kinase (ribokinase family)